MTTTQAAPQSGERVKFITWPFNIKSVGDDGAVEGYASVFHNVDSYRDVVMPGAFKESIAGHVVKGAPLPMLWQHRADSPIGVWPTEKMSEDEHGLRVCGQLCLDTNRGREARALMKMRAIRGLSIGFSVPEGGEAYDSDAKVNKLHKVNLWEISPVTFPANEQANVSQVRSAWLKHNALPPEMVDEIISSPRRFERFLRDAGLPKSIANSLAAKMIRTALREADTSEADIQKRLAGLLNSINAHRA